MTLHRIVFGCVLALGLALGSTAHATHWNTSSDGSWHDPNNWTNGLPAAPGEGNKHAWFGGGGGIFGTGNAADVTITLDQDPGVQTSGALRGIVFRNFAAGESATLDVEWTGGTINLSSVLRLAEQGSNTTAVINHRDGVEINLGDTVSIGGGGHGTYNMYGGKLNATSSDGIVVGHIQSGGSGTFNLYGGEVTVAPLRVGHDADGTFNQYGGDVTVSSGRFEMGRNANGVGAYTIRDGSLTVTPNVVFMGSQGESTFTVYGRAEVAFTHASTDWRIGWGSGGVGTVRAVIDETGFNPITTGGTIRREFNGLEANLEVALDGGISLNQGGSFTLINYNALHGNDLGWTNDPGDGVLWDYSEGGGAMSVALSSVANRGTLDISQAGNRIDFADDHDLGWSELNGSPGGVDLKLLLELVGTEALVDDFQFALTEAGYQAWRPGDFEIGLSLAWNGDDRFAWDLTGFTNPDPSILQLSAITVIPEPTTYALGLLGAAGLALLRWRRRKNWECGGI